MAAFSRLERHLVARGAEPLAGVAQDGGARVVGPVDAVPEAHEALAAVEDTLDVCRRVTRALDTLDHVLGARGGATVQRPREGADGTGHAGRDVGAGGGDDPGREGRGVHAVLGGGDEVGVDGLDVGRVGLAAPADHEALDDRLALVDATLRHHRLVLPVGGLRDERQGHDGGSGEVVAGLGGVDVEERLEAPDRREPAPGPTGRRPGCRRCGRAAGTARPAEVPGRTRCPRGAPTPGRRLTRPTRSLMSTPR